MFKAKLIFFLIFFNCWSVVFSQDEKAINQLKKEIASCNEDTIKVRKLVKLTLKLSRNDFKNALASAYDAFSLARKLNYTQGEIRVYNSIGDSYWYHSDYEKAQEYYFKAYRISDSIHDDRQIANSLYNIGWIVCIQQHNYAESNYLYKSWNIFERLKDTIGMLRIYGGLSSFYADRYTESNSKQYFDSAIIYFNKGIKVAKKAGLSLELGTIYGNMGELFYLQKDYPSAVFYNSKCFDIKKASHDSSSMVICLTSMGLCALKTNQTKEAIRLFNDVISFTSRHDIKDIQSKALEGISEAYYLMKDYKTAYDYHNKYVVIKDQIDKETYSTNISNLQSNYSLGKSEANVKQLTQTNEIQELKNKKNTYFIFGLLAIAFIVIIVASLLFKQNKQKQLTNLQLKEQNHIIAEKKHEIDNSIQYAKGIQQAILPSVEELINHLPQSFVYYKPKDVVSGDFYWFSNVGDDFYCIAADCTGHGVPGALMSIIGMDKIVQAVFEKKISNPGLILSYLNQQIKQVLKQQSDSSKQMDGMDLALLKFNKSFTTVEFSGANRPLIIIRDKVIIEYKADKLAIAGFTSNEQQFTTTKIDLQKNDSLYIFTDGYADQFGGESGKKFMSKKLKELLVSISDLPHKQQEQHIATAFGDWKGSYEQVDDVLIIGIKI
jgi:serine phosphatase RsbU (regulator of sigma subunit)